MTIIGSKLLMYWICWDPNVVCFILRLYHPRIWLNKFPESNLLCSPSNHSHFNILKSNIWQFIVYSWQKASTGLKPLGNNLSLQNFLVANMFKNMVMNLQWLWSQVLCSLVPYFKTSHEKWCKKLVSCYFKKVLKWIWTWM